MATRPRRAREGPAADGLLTETLVTPVRGYTGGGVWRGALEGANRGSRTRRREARLWL